MRDCIGYLLGFWEIDSVLEIEKNMGIGFRIIGGLIIDICMYDIFGIYFLYGNLGL